jgi:hypothetical protein
MENPEVANAVYWLDWFHIARNVGAALVVLGVAVELLGDWLARPYEKKVDGARIAEIARANESAATANARAAQAELELVKLKAPRFLNEQQMQFLTKAMKPFKGQRASVGAVPFTFESASLANQIVLALKAAGANVDLNQGAAEVQVGAANGVVARATTGNDKGEQFALTFAQAMNENGIKAKAIGGLLEDIMQKSIEGGRPRNDPGNEWVVIVVGDKI